MIKFIPRRKWRFLILWGFKLILNEFISSEMFFKMFFFYEMHLCDHITWCDHSRWKERERENNYIYLSLSLFSLSHAWMEHIFSYCHSFCRLFLYCHFSRASLFSLSLFLSHRFSSSLAISLMWNDFSHMTIDFLQLLSCANVRERVPPILLTSLSSISSSLSTL